jgi:hypothetical protein
MECLPSKGEALSSNRSTTKKKKKKRIHEHNIICVHLILHK